MSGAGGRPGDGTRRARTVAGQGQPQESELWSALGTIVAGPLAWAGLGWLADEATGSGAFLPAGVAVGAAGSLWLVWHRFGRPLAQDQQDRTTNGSTRSTGTTRQDSTTRPTETSDGAAREAGRTRGDRR